MPRSSPQMVGCREQVRGRGSKSSNARPVRAGTGPRRPAPRSPRRGQHLCTERESLQPDQLVAACRGWLRVFATGGGGPPPDGGGGRAGTPPRPAPCAAVVEEDLHGVGDRALVRIEVVARVARVLDDLHLLAQPVDPRVARRVVLVVLGGERPVDAARRPPCTAGSGRDRPDCAAAPRLSMIRTADSCVSMRDALDFVQPARAPGGAAEWRPRRPSGRGTRPGRRP